MQGHVSIRLAPKTPQSVGGHILAASLGHCWQSCRAVPVSLHCRDVQQV